MYTVSFTFVAVKNWFKNNTCRPGFFHRFLRLQTQQNFQNLSLGEKSLSLEKYPFILMGEIKKSTWVCKKNLDFEQKTLEFR